MQERTPPGMRVKPRFFGAERTKQKTCSALSALWLTRMPAGAVSKNDAIVSQPFGEMLVIEELQQRDRMSARETE